VTSRRTGYTLFELIITTAVIAITAAVTVPSLDSMYPSYKMNASVDAIRAAWAQGRAHAIEDGRPYRFAVSPGTGKYRLSADDDPADGGSQANDASQGRSSYTLEEELPKGVAFALAQDQGEAQQSSSSSDGLSTVAVFLPDGTARDDAEITLRVTGTLPKSVKLRGLTGAVTVQQADGGGAR
jgi:prepilin-type N-terminal cleavage/methylation domain-containing protein